MFEFSCLLLVLARLRKPNRTSLTSPFFHSVPLLSFFVSDLIENTCPILLFTELSVGWESFWAQQPKDSHVNRVCQSGVRRDAALASLLSLRQLGGTSTEKKKMVRTGISGHTYACGEKRWGFRRVEEVLQIILRTIIKWVGSHTLWSILVLHWASLFDRHGYQVWVLDVSVRPSRG